MAEWYETPPEQRTNEQRQRAQQAYYHVLLSTAEGREVICDMQRRIREEKLDRLKNNDSAAQLCLEEYFEDTITLCGVDNTMQLAEAQAQIAKSYIHKEEKPDVPEDYSE